MKLIEIKLVDGTTQEVNLDCLGAIVKDENDSQITLCFSGCFVNVNENEYKRIREMLDQNSINVLSEVSKTEDPIEKIKEVIYRATYLDSNAKLQLIMQLDNLK